MLWFNKQKKEDVKKLEQLVTIEVENAKHASDKEVAKNKKITEKFNKVLRENNFTIRVHSAAVGKH